MAVVAHGEPVAGPPPVPAGSPVVGIVGAGQLARMTYQAAIALGLRPRLLARRDDDAAALVGADVLVGDPCDARALDRLAAGCDVVTLDHELIDLAALAAVARRRGVAVRPAPHAAALATDKARQRAALADAGLPLPPHALVASADEVDAFAAEHGWPLVLKLPTGGYDGRGVFVAHDLGDARPLLERGPLLAEPRLALDAELAVLVARRPGGESVVYPVVETRQSDGICRELVVPGPVAPELASAASRLALSVADAIDATGVLAVELFVTGGRLLVNELATRPHNSGHFSIEGALTSQFENHLRAVLDWPLGDTALTAPAVATVNVLGASAAPPADALPRALAVPRVSVHAYGKPHRPGRKLGHVTALGPDAGDALERARRAAAILAGEDAA